ncbi:MAG: hypothetical protein JXB26_08185 [Candidatus Aminicenantes bacterium]|nr:hypothetical protein [Candidatus Aminicenantes bacterium]
MVRPHRLSAVFLFFFFFCSGFMVAENIQFLREVLLQENSFLLEKPASFVKTKDGSFIIADFQAGDLKIFRPSGEILKTFGRKGRGPGDFLGPFSLSYCYPRLGLVDIDRRMVFIMKVGCAGDVRIVDEFKCPGGITRISLSREKAVLAGYLVDGHGVSSSIFQYIFSSCKKVPVFSNFEIYGYSSHKEYEKKRINEIIPLGLRVLCCQKDDAVFGLWDKRLRILKKEIRSGEVILFGKRTANFQPGKITKAVKTAYKKRDQKKLREEEKKTSFIMNVAVTGNLFLLFYKNENPEKYFMQVYNQSGNFIKEVLLPSRFEGGFLFVSENEKVFYELICDDRTMELKFRIRAYGFDFSSR